ncbi:putative TKL/IRAK protein kinase [Blattamonas nauphoetae]|uniref:TKL/IRAK protein kinase n=1 Tax=Blattamonas nauphoetae TaxID=2049346 RepID=A0ABQ9XSD2_9EUKA|nr:putative TKL/IRAK protein kinase [Blattamonas nauphoetae]
MHSIYIHIKLLLILIHNKALLKAIQLTNSPSQTMIPFENLSPEARLFYPLVQEAEDKRLFHSLFNFLSKTGIPPPQNNFNSYFSHLYYLLKPLFFYLRYLPRTQTEFSFSEVVQVAAHFLINNPEFYIDRDRKSLKQAGRLVLIWERLSFCLPQADYNTIISSVLKSFFTVLRRLSSRPLSQLTDSHTFILDHLQPFFTSLRSPPTPSRYHIPNYASCFAMPFPSILISPMLSAAMVKQWISTDDIIQTVSPWLSWTETGGNNSFNISVIITVSIHWLDPSPYIRGMYKDWDDFDPGNRTPSSIIPSMNKLPDPPPFPPVDVFLGELGYERAARFEAANSPATREAFRYVCDICKTNQYQQMSQQTCSTFAAFLRKTLRNNHDESFFDDYAQIRPSNLTLAEVQDTVDLLTDCKSFNKSLNFKVSKYVQDNQLVQSFISRDLDPTLQTKIMLLPSSGNNSADGHLDDMWTRFGPHTLSEMPIRISVFVQLATNLFGSKSQLSPTGVAKLSQCFIKSIKTYRNSLAHLVSLLSSFMDFTNYLEIEQVQNLPCVANVILSFLLNWPQPSMDDTIPIDALPPFTLYQQYSHVESLQPRSILVAVQPFIDELDQNGGVNLHTTLINLVNLLVFVRSLTNSTNLPFPLSNKLFTQDSTQKAVVSSRHKYALLVEKNDNLQAQLSTPTTVDWGVFFNIQLHPYVVDSILRHHPPNTSHDWWGGFYSTLGPKYLLKLLFSVVRNTSLDWTKASPLSGILTLLSKTLFTGGSFNKTRLSTFGKVNVLIGQDETLQPNQRTNAFNKAKKTLNPTVEQLFCFLLSLIGMIDICSISAGRLIIALDVGFKMEPEITITLPHSFFSTAFNLAPFPRTPDYSVFVALDSISKERSDRLLRSDQFAEFASMFLVPHSFLPPNMRPKMSSFYTTYTKMFLSFLHSSSLSQQKANLLQDTFASLRTFLHELSSPELKNQQLFQQITSLSLLAFLLHRSDGSEEAFLSDILSPEYLLAVSNFVLISPPSIRSLQPASVRSLSTRLPKDQLTPFLIHILIEKDRIFLPHISLTGVHHISSNRKTLGFTPLPLNRIVWFIASLSEGAQHLDTGNLDLFVTAAHSILLSTKSHTTSTALDDYTRTQLFNLVLKTITPTHVPKPLVDMIDEAHEASSGIILPFGDSPQLETKRNECCLPPTLRQGRKMTEMTAIVLQLFYHLQFRNIILNMNLSEKSETSFLSSILDTERTKRVKLELKQLDSQNCSPSNTTPISFLENLQSTFSRLSKAKGGSVEAFQDSQTQADSPPSNRLHQLLAFVDSFCASHRAPLLSSRLFGVPINSTLNTAQFNENDDSFNLHYTVQYNPSQGLSLESDLRRQLCVQTTQPDSSSDLPNTIFVHLRQTQSTWSGHIHSQLLHLNLSADSNKHHLKYALSGVVVRTKTGTPLYQSIVSDRITGDWWLHSDGKPVRFFINNLSSCLGENAPIVPTLLVYERILPSDEWILERQYVDKCRLQNKPCSNIPPSFQLLRLRDVLESDITPDFIKTAIEQPIHKVFSPSFLNFVADLLSKVADLPPQRDESLIQLQLKTIMLFLHGPCHIVKPVVGAHETLISNEALTTLSASPELSCLVLKSLSAQLKADEEAIIQTPVSSLTDGAQNVFCQTTSALIVSYVFYCPKPDVKNLFLSFLKKCVMSIGNYISKNFTKKADFKTIFKDPICKEQFLVLIHFFSLFLDSFLLHGWIPHDSQSEKQSPDPFQALIYFLSVLQSPIVSSAFFVSGGPQRILELTQDAASPLCFTRTHQTQFSLSRGWLGSSLQIPLIRERIAKIPESLFPNRDVTKVNLITSAMDALSCRLVSDFSFSQFTEQTGRSNGTTISFLTPLLSDPSTFDTLTLEAFFAVYPNVITSFPAEHRYRYFNTLVAFENEKKDLTQSTITSHIVTSLSNSLTILPHYSHKTRLDLLSQLFFVLAIDSRADFEPKLAQPSLRFSGCLSKVFFHLFPQDQVFPYPSELCSALYLLAHYARHSRIFSMHIINELCDYLFDVAGKYSFVPLVANILLSCFYKKCEPVKSSDNNEATPWIETLVLGNHLNRCSVFSPFDTTPCIEDAKAHDQSHLLKDVPLSQVLLPTDSPPNVSISFDGSPASMTFFRPKICKAIASHFPKENTQLQHEYLDYFGPMFDWVRELVQANVEQDTVQMRDLLQKDMKTRERELNAERERQEAERQREEAEKQRIQSLKQREEDVLKRENELRMTAEEQFRKEERMNTKMREMEKERERMAMKREELSKQEQRLNMRKTELSTKEEGLKTKEAELSTKEEGLKTKEAELSTKEEGLKTKEAELSTKEEGLKTKEAELSTKEEGLKTKEAELSTKEEGLKTKEAELSTKEEGLKTKEAELSTKEEGLKTKEAELSTKEEGLKTKEAELSTKEEGLKTKEAELSTKEEGLKTKEAELSTKEEGLKTKEAELSTKEEGLKTKEAELSTKEEGLKTKEAELSTKEEGLKTKEAELSTKEEGLKTKEAELSTKEEGLKTKEAELSTKEEGLKTKEAELSTKEEGLKTKEAELSTKEEGLKTKEAELSTKEEGLKTKEAELSTKEEGLKTKEAELSTKEEGLKTKEAELSTKEEGLKTKEAELSTKEEGLKTKEAELSTKEEGLKTKEAELSTKEEGLKTKEAELSTKEEGLKTKEAEPLMVKQGMMMQEALSTSDDPIDLSHPQTRSAEPKSFKTMKTLSPAPKSQKKSLSPPQKTKPKRKKGGS